LVGPAEPELASIPRPQLNFPEEKRSAKSILLVAALVLVAVGLGWAWFHHAVQLTTSASTLPIRQAESSAQTEEPQLSSQPPIKPGANPEVTGIRHWSSPTSSTVVVDLQDQIQYEAHTLDNPPRVYFDLQDTKMTSGLLNQSISVDDSFLKRVRMAQPRPDVTRVVLETKGLSEVSVKLDPNPYRLTIDVHKVPSTPLPATLSKPSPSLTIAPKAKTSHPASSAASEFRVVLDAGHGGWDLGTVGRKGLLEKDLVLDVVQRLGKLIEQKLGADVIYTRQDDEYLPLEKRAEIANLASANLFLSVHANYSDLATARGVETYYTTTYSSIKARTSDDDPALKNVNWTGVDIREKVMNSHRLADDIQHALYGGLAERNPEIRNRGVKEAQYVVLTGTQMPAILAEISFVSSPADEDNLQSSEYRQHIAESLYIGVAKYRLEEKQKHTKMASNRKLASSE
jgi:N-acetylmuramoyl-L-alanine amidase